MYELLKIAEAVESPLTETEIRDMITMASGGKDTVSLADFKTFMSGTPPAFAQTDEVIKAFETVADDPANPGKIRLKVAMDTLANIGNKLTADEMAKFEQDARAKLVDGTDSVDFVALAQAWTKAETMASTN